MSLSQIYDILQNIASEQGVITGRVDEIHQRIVHTFDEVDDVLDNVRRIEHLVIVILILGILMFMHKFYVIMQMRNRAKSQTPFQGSHEEEH